jgi:hypothetical protein
MSMPTRTGSSAACNRCGGQRGSVVISTERGFALDSVSVTEIVRLCYPCRSDASRENKAAILRRRAIDKPPTT